MQIFVRGKRVNSNSRGDPLMVHFLQCMCETKDVNDLVREFFDYNDVVDNVEDTINKLSRALGVSKRSLWEHIRIGSAEKVKKARVIPLSISQEDIPIFDDEEDEVAEWVQPPKDKEEEDEEILSISDEEEDEPKMIPVVVDPIVPNTIDSNARALKALTNALAFMDPVQDRDLYRMTKTAMANYVMALCKNVAPPPPNELFSVRERALALKMDISKLSVQAVGKKAYEYYCTTYPGKKPMQRLVTDGDHTYMMNLYSEFTAPKTVDRALREALKKRK